MENNKFFEELKKKVKTMLGEKGSHDFNHIERVYKYSIIISKGLNVDLDIVKASALLHDIAKSKEEKREVKDHATQSAIEARKILKKMKFPEEKIEIVYKCILLHNKKEDLPEIKEVRVLKEADALEAIGAIGVARTFSYIGEKTNWNPSLKESPLNLLISRSNPNYLKIPIARKLARKKLKFVNKFCNQFIKEFNLCLNK